MFILYSLIYTLVFIVLSPRFLFDALFKGKYAAGFGQRLGRLPTFDSYGRKVVWLHCVSVGETNAARPLAQRIKQEFPSHSLVVSTTTRTGQKVARAAFANLADLVFYFPFDWRFTVRRSLRHIKPSVVLLTETEIWPNFIRETSKSNARTAIVNGRLSERSFNRYVKVRKFIRRTLGYLDLALMQGNADATRLMSLGLRASKVKVTGNLKYDHDPSESETALTAQFRERFGISPEAPLVVAASTHSPEERWVIEALTEVSSAGKRPRLMIAPRHPERFEEVAEIARKSGFHWVRRSERPSPRDKTAEIILLDSIGELRAAYPLAELVFVGGSLIPHGGQSLFEPAAVGKPIIIGHYTANFASAIEDFRAKDALVQLRSARGEEVVEMLVKVFKELLGNPERRRQLGGRARELMADSRGAVDKTIEYLSPLFGSRG